MRGRVAFRAVRGSHLQLYADAAKADEIIPLSGGGRVGTERSREEAVRDEVDEGTEFALRGDDASLRIGGATAALAAGVPPQLIRLMGRWSSDVYELYCRMSQEAALGVGRAIASAVVTAPEDGFREEQLELRTEEVDRWGELAAGLQVEMEGDESGGVEDVA